MRLRTHATPLLVLLALVAGGSALLAQTGPAAVAPAADRYTLGPKDLLQIRVFGAPEFDSEARVSESGTIKLPIVGEVAVEGLTEAQATTLLEERLEECCVQRASVAVQVLEYRARPISVIGAVHRPGPLSFSGRWTLLEALTAAGGLTDDHGNQAVILRRADNGLSDQLTVPLDRLLSEGDSRLNVPLLANDLVHVPAAVEVTVFCLGEVGRPGAYSFRSTERITVLTALAKAGGLTDRAASRILVKRETAAGPTRLEADYKRIVAGRSPDLELQAGDILLVKESFF
jgi:polysaccharide biosynthesis/export protein